MEYVNLHYNGAQIGTNVPFQRVPTVGEYVAFQGQWHQATSVMYDWQAGAPIAVIGGNQHCHENHLYRDLAEFDFR